MSAPSQLPPTRVAAALGGGLLLLVVLLSVLAPAEPEVGWDDLATLVSDGHVAAIEVGEDGVVARLSQELVLKVEGMRRRARGVRVTGPIPPAADSALTAWSTRGLPVRATQPTTRDHARRAVWVVGVFVLLGFGIWHLVAQARRYRREGSPRQRLEAARQDLEAGRITPEEFERQASDLSLEQ